MGRNRGRAAAVLGDAFVRAFIRAFIRTQAGPRRCASHGDRAAGPAVCDLHSVSNRLHDGRSQHQAGRAGDGEIETGPATAFPDEQRLVDAGL